MGKRRSDGISIVSVTVTSAMGADDSLAAPDVLERFAGLSVEPRANSPEQFQQLVETYAKRWAKVARDANVKVE